MRTLLWRHRVESANLQFSVERQPLVIGRLRLFGALLILGCMLFIPAASAAGPISFSVFNPSQYAPPGSVVVFQGTITNNTGSDLAAADLFLNSFGFDPDVVSITQLLGNPDFTIQPGTTTLVSIFNFGISPAAAINSVYFASIFLQDINDNFSDTVDVSVTATDPIPEPGTFILITCGLLLIWVFRAHALHRHSPDSELRSSNATPIPS
jgi:hypothetical protein